MSTRHQTKAERTFFPRQRRCISESLNKHHSTSSSSTTTTMENVINNIKQEQQQILISPKRQRYSTEIKAEILETDPEFEDDEEEDEIIDVLNIEDDVVIDTDEKVVVAKIKQEDNDNDRVLEL